MILYQTLKLYFEGSCTLNDSQEDDDDKEEECDVEHQSQHLVWVS